MPKEEILRKAAAYDVREMLNAWEMAYIFDQAEIDENNIFSASCIQEMPPEHIQKCLKKLEDHGIEATAIDQENPWKLTLRISQSPKEVLTNIGNIKIAALKERYEFSIGESKEDKIKQYFTRKMGKEVCGIKNDLAAFDAIGEANAKRHEYLGRLQQSPEKEIE